MPTRRPSAATIATGVAAAAALAAPFLAVRRMKKQLTSLEQIYRGIDETLGLHGSKAHQAAFFWGVIEPICGRAALGTRTSPEEVAKLYKAVTMHQVWPSMPSWCKDVCLHCLCRLACTSKMALKPGSLILVPTGFKLVEHKPGKIPDGAPPSSRAAASSPKRRKSASSPKRK